MVKVCTPPYAEAQALLINHARIAKLNPSKALLLSLISFDLQYTV